MLFSYFLADPYAPSHGDDTSDETARHSRHTAGLVRYAVRYGIVTLE
jgi:hypothetical protein